MVNVEYKEAISETLDILNHMKKEDVIKISPKFMDFLKNNVSESYTPKLDHSKKIKDMQLNTKTKAILAIIYKKFWCTEKEANDFEKKLLLNEIVYQEELQKKYNSDNLFKNIISNSSTNDLSETTALVPVEKGGFIYKIINRIKKLFK